MTALDDALTALSTAAGRLVAAGAQVTAAAAQVAALATPPPTPPPPPPTGGIPAGANTVTVGSSSYPLAAVDPTAASNPAGAGFDGFRGPGQLVAYTTASGARTGTNQYGAEVAVVGGRFAGAITDGASGGLVIPDGGYVLSGHGAAKAWLLGAYAPGAAVVLAVSATPTPAPNPTPGPTPGPAPAATGRVRMLWHYPSWSGWGGPDPTHWPDDVLKSVTHVSCGVAQSAQKGTGLLKTPDLAAKAFLRGDKILVGAQIGGSKDGGISILTSANADEFIGSVESWGVDFADCDLEPSGGKWTHDPMVAALRGCAQVTGHGSVVTSGLYTDQSGNDWTARWGAVCKALGDDLAFWVSMNYDFIEAGNAADLARVTRDKIGLMRRYVPDEKIVMAYMPRPSANYVNASPPGVIPAAYAAGRSGAPIGWALWEDKIGTATNWLDLRALAKL